MGRNLGPLNIKNSYEGLVQISGSQLTDGSGSLIPNVDVTASNATTAVSSSYALTASYAENAGEAVNTGSLLVTASVVNATTTYTKGDGSTFNTVIDNVDTATSASYALTATSASHAVQADTATTATTAAFASAAATASYVAGANVDGAVANATSASYALTASFAENVPAFNTGSFMITGSVTDATLTFTKGDTSTFPLTVNNVANATSASYAVSSSHALVADEANTSVSSSYAISASHAVNADSALTADTATSASHALVADTATTATTATTASYILGSNVDGAVANATSASYAVSSSQAENADTAITATTATSASHALVADTATTATTATTASYILGSNVDGAVATATSSSYALTASYAENAPVSDPFPYTGSAIISGSLEVTGSVGVDNLLQMADNEISGSITYDDANQYSIIGGNSVTFGNFNADSYVKGNDNVFVVANGTNNTFQRALRVSGSFHSAMIASSNCALGTNLGYTGTASNQAIIASEGSIIAGGVPMGGIYSSKNSQIYGSGNPRTVSAIFGGQNNLINQSFACQIYGGDDNRIPNGFVDQNNMLGGQNNDITGGNRHLIIGSENGVISAGTRNRIIGGNNHLISNGTGYATILGGYNHDVTGGTYANIVGGRDCLISAGGSVATILGSRSSTISGATGAVDTIGISLGQQNQITSGYVDYIFGGRENKIENRSTSAFANVIVGAYNSRLHGTTTGRSAILGGSTNDLGVTADVNESAIIVGNSHNMAHDRSVILGGTGIASTKNDEVSVPNLTVSGSSIYEVETLGFNAGASTNMVCEASDYFELDMGPGSTTDLVPFGIQAGQEIVLKVTQDPTTPSTLTFDNSIEWAGGVKPTLTASPSAVDIFKFTSFGGGITYGSIVGQNFS